MGINAFYCGVSNKMIKLRERISSLLRGRPLTAPVFRNIRSSMLLGSFHTSESNIMQQFTVPGTIAIDIGANVGQYTHVLSRLVKNSGYVMAFEPNPSAFRELVLGSRGRRIWPFEVALSSTDGIGCLTSPVSPTFEELIQLGTLNPHLSNNIVKQIQVTTNRLDKYLPFMHLRVSFIKIDVEGHEYEVLTGAEKLIAKHKPTMVIEIEHRHQPNGRDAETTINWLKSRGMVVEGILGKKLISSTEALERQHAMQADVTRLKISYTNNFLCRFA